MTQKTGALIFDETADRYDIRFDVNDYYGGLHCGDCMEVFVRGKWKPTRMVMLSRLVDTFFSRTSWTMLLYAENHSISVA